MSKRKRDAKLEEYLIRGVRPVVEDHLADVDGARPGESERRPSPAARAHPLLRVYTPRGRESSD